MQHECIINIELYVHKIYSIQFRINQLCELFNYLMFAMCGSRENLISNLIELKTFIFLLESIINESI